MTDKERIIQLFNENVKGKKPNVSNKNTRHDGKYGHWLEEQFGIAANGDNAPDLYGYELKNTTTSNKTSFGDWSADYYIYKDPKFYHIFKGNKVAERQNSFLYIFGQHNMKKDRYSWSGSPCPNINGYNSFGQVLKVTENNDIIAMYSYSHDQRIDKATIVPLELQKDAIILAKWSKECIKKHFEDKFNVKGWFTCKQDSTGTYNEICFGLPMNYENWIILVKKGVVFFDSGMYEGNPRPYSMWRASNNYWNSLIVERY